MASKTQLKKQAQAAAAAAGRMEDGEMPQMPQMPDPNMKYLWSGDPAVKQFDFAKFIQVYPCYIDSTLTLDEGRRMGKEFCCDLPNVNEISEMCQSLKLRHVIEPYKMYPRLFGRPGRVRVEIFNADGSFINPEITKKNDLLKYMGSRIPQLNSRIARMAKQAEEDAVRRLEEEKQLQLQQAVSTGGSSNNKKKKGKKK